MPDWVTHLGTTYIVAQTGSKLLPGWMRPLEVRHLLLGALLPDVTRFTIILVDILDWPAIPTFSYFIPFHSLLIIALLAAALAVMLPATGNRSDRAFIFIMLGAGLHFFLDGFDGLFGCGSTVFYPLYFRRLFTGWDSEGNFAHLLLVVSGVAISFAVGQRRQWPSLNFSVTRGRVVWAAGLVLLALVVPLFFQQLLIDRNAYFLGFVINPTAFEGQSVELCFSEVVATKPLVIEEFDTAFVVQTTDSFSPGEWLSVRGIYQNGLIRPAILIRHRSFSDVGVSAIAAIAFIWLMIDWRDVEAVKHWLKDKLDR